MAKVLILGEYRAERIVSAVSEYIEADIVLCGGRDVSRYLSVGVRHRDLHPSAGPDEIMSMLHEEAPDLVLPNVYPRGQEQMLTTYAEVAVQWQAAGGAMPVHSPAFAELACDKAMFQTTGNRRGWPVPAGQVCRSAAELGAAAAYLGLPIMVKEARSQPVEGRRLVDSREVLKVVMATMPYPVVAQRAYRGDEFGVEFLSTADVTLRWPLATLGRLPPGRGPGRRVRMMPCGLPPSAFRSLQEFVTDVTAAYEVVGPWQVDIAVADGDLYVLEINARLSGMSNMSHLATGVDPHRAFVASCFGDIGEPPRPTHVSMELPIESHGDLPVPPSGVQHEVDIGSPTDRCLLTAGYRRLRVQATPSSAVLSWLDKARHLLRVPFHEIEAQFAHARHRVLSAAPHLAKPTEGP